MADSRKSRGMAFLLVGLALAVLFLFELGLTSITLREEVLDGLKDFQTRQLDLFLEMNKLMTTLATVALGAVTGFLPGIERIGVARRRVVGVWVLLGISLYSGFLAMQQVMWMLDKRFFNLYYPGIAWPARIQFWAFLIGVFLIAELVYRGARKEEQ